MHTTFDEWEEAVEAIHEAAYEGDIEGLARAIECGTDVDMPERENPETLGMTALHFAAYGGQLAAVKLLLRHGADVNRCTAYGVAPLAMAAGEGNSPPVVRELAAAGAELDHSDRRGRTALFMAAINGNCEVVKVLIEAGVDLNRATEDGYSPLRIARSRSDVGVVALLEGAGAKG